jgi:hypothetical protein
MKHLYDITIKESGPENESIFLARSKQTDDRINKKEILESWTPTGFQISNSGCPRSPLIAFTNGWLKDNPPAHGLMGEFTLTGREKCWASSSRSLIIRSQPVARSSFSDR